MNWIFKHCFLPYLCWLQRFLNHAFFKTAGKMKYDSTINIYICKSIRKKTHWVCFWVSRSGCICCLKRAGTSTWLQSRLYYSAAEADLNSWSAEAIRGCSPPGILGGTAPNQPSGWAGAGSPLPSRSRCPTRLASGTLPLSAKPPRPAQVKGKIKRCSWQPSQGQTATWLPPLLHMEFAGNMDMEVLEMCSNRQ